LPVLGPLVILAVFALALLGVTSAVVNGVRHGSKGRGALACGAIGAPLVLAWAVLYMGLREGAWSVRSPGAWLAALVGLLGVCGVGYSFLASWRPRPGRGQCLDCGYSLGGLARCPECGREAKRT
jgi:hypothetical protein